METPTRIAAALFRTKATLLQLDRMAWDFRHGIGRCDQTVEQRPGVVVATSSSPLWTDERESEGWYQRGKIQNLRVAAARLHGTIIPAGTVFSFWKSVGRATHARGFVEGRMLQQGCMIPAVGTLRFALLSRRLADQGATRQNALLRRSRELAGTLSRVLNPDVDEVVVSQSLLPFLWMSGDLGGRRVRVLMGSLPIASLHAALDAALLAHPESPTLGDFRGPQWLTEYEAESWMRPRRSSLRTVMWGDPSLRSG